MNQTTDLRKPGRVLCFGELLLRLTPTIDASWIKNAQTSIYVGGAEANVANALSKWNVPVNYLTALPDNFMSHQIIAHLNETGVNTPDIHFNGKRIGTYFLPKGSDIKNSGVIYDREYSSFSELKPGMIDWDKAIDGINWFHFSAISPALNANVAAVCEEALRVAASKNITISVDLNYRSKLWQYGKSPLDVMPQLIAYCDLVMGNVWAAETMLGIPVCLNEAENITQTDYIHQATITSKEIIKQFPKCKAVANTFRFTQHDENIRYYAALYENEKTFVSKEHSTFSIVDKVGSGDCFMGALIHGFVNQLPGQEIIDFAAGAAFDKLFVEGDATDRTVDDIKSRIECYG